MAFSSVAIAVFSFFVWAHHMFIMGISNYSALVFSLMSMLVAVPSAIKVFNWSATMYKGSITFDTPMLYAFGFIGLFTMGGLTGVLLASLGMDIHLTETYFIVAHFHYVMVGGMVSAYMAGLHFWWPKMTGRMYPESLGRLAAVDPLYRLQSHVLPAVHSWLSGHAAALSCVSAGIPGVERALDRGASILAIGYLLPAIYLLWSLKYGRLQAPIPGGRRLEWQVQSPPLTENFLETPIVDFEAYDYRMAGEQDRKRGKDRWIAKRSQPDTWNRTKRHDAHEHPPYLRHHFATVGQQREARQLRHVAFPADRNHVFRRHVHGLSHLPQLVLPRLCGRQQLLTSGAGTTNTAVLICSSFTMAMGVYSRRNAQPQGLLLLPDAHLCWARLSWHQGR